MNIVYVIKDCLYIVEKYTLINVNLSVYFSSSKYSLVYINDENGQLCGYVDHKLYKNQNGSTLSLYQPFKEILVEGHYLTNMVDKMFEQNPNLVAIPVVDEKRKLIGAYVKTVSAELDSNERVMNTIAISILPSFIEELKCYLTYKNINKLYIISSDEDYNEIESLLSSIVEIQRYNGKIMYTKCCMFIDMLYSKSYRNSLLTLIGVEILSLEDLLAHVLLPIAIEYVKKNGSKLLFVEGPLKERINGAIQKWPQLYKNLTLPEAVNDKKLLNKFCNEDSRLIEWSQNTSIGIMAGDEVCTNGIHLLMSKNLNVKIGEDKRSCIYIFGSCFSYGACVPCEYRISSILQMLRPDYRIINNGVKNGRSILNDVLYILNTPIKKGDILIDINVYTSTTKNIICSYEPILDFNKYLNTNINEKCQFLDNTFHANIEVTNITAQYLAQITPKTKSVIDNTCRRYFEEENKISKINTQKILGKSLMSSYLDYINAHKKQISGNKVVGSVILTANPITKGHEHLIKIAKSKCDLLYIFIVEEDSFEFSTSERMDLVRTVISDNNIIILSTGKVMTARYTFPDYYQKSHAKAESKINPISDLHFYLFGSVVAPILGITKRFVGEEIIGSVTDYYNKKLQSILPSYNIDVEIIPRLCDYNGSIISGSKVRQMINNQKFDSLSDSLSPRILEYILNTRKEIMIRDGRWSTTFKRGNKFLKKYKYHVPDAAKREAKASNAARLKGILTPTHLITKTDCYIVNVFEYVEIHPIDVVAIYNNVNFWCKISSIISELQQVEWQHDDNYWNSHLIPEFKNAISHIDIDYKRYYDFLETLQPKVFIHGDFTFDNIGITNNDLILFDFQHGCLGPVGWDKAYLAATMIFTKCKLKLNPEEEKMAEIIAAIRYGRAIRKKNDINNRKIIFNSWKKRQ